MSSFTVYGQPDPAGSRELLMAQGSHKTWGGWETRVCHVCSRRITLSDPGAYHSARGDQGGPVSVHQSCGGLAVLKGAA